MGTREFIWTFVLLILLPNLSIQQGCLDIGTGPGCRDCNDLCPGWAADGECKKNAGYTWIWCKRSCNHCEECEDLDESCPGYAAVGNCKKGQYKEWMISNCPKSCHQCETPSGNVVVR